MGFLLWFHLYFISVLNKHLLNVVRLEGSVLLPLNLGFMALISILNSQFLCHYYINDFLSHQSDISCGMRPCLSLIHDYVLCLAWGSPSGSYNLMAETHHNRPVTQGDTCSISTGLWQVQVSPERELSHLPRGGKQSLRRVPWGSRYLIFFFLISCLIYLFLLDWERCCVDKLWSDGQSSPPPGVHTWAASEAKARNFSEVVAWNLGILSSI